jgi:hypothetical protein
MGFSNLLLIELEQLGIDAIERGQKRVVPRKLPRPGNLWVTAGSASGLTEEAMEFAAGRVE